MVSLLMSGDSNIEVRYMPGVGTVGISIILGGDIEFQLLVFKMICKTSQEINLVNQFCAFIWNALLPLGQII